MNTNFNPFIFKIPTGNSSVLKDKFDKSDNNVIISNVVNYPLISLGYHSFLHRTRSAMDITKKLETKNDFYYVVNPFEHKINDYEKDLDESTKEFFKMKEDDPKILSRSFYKMWEILYYFDIVNKENLTYAAIADGNGSFLQSVLKFREKYGYDMKKDKYFGVTLHPEDSKKSESGKQFINYYDKVYPDLLNIHKTYPREKAMKLKSKSDGDITQVKTISLFKKEISKNKAYADLVTADGGFDWVDENYQEQEGYQLILGEIIAALRVQETDGTFVLKLFDTFTLSTIKMIYLVSSFYKDAYICKPLFSRESNSERYLICKGFKYDQIKDKSSLNSKIEVLENILEKLSTESYLQDIFPNLDVPTDYLNMFKFINIQIANRQQVMINKIVTYIKGNNYYGDKFHEYREEQIKATTWWVENFLTDKYDKNIIKKFNNMIGFNTQEEIQFSKKLV
jgi:23S rRNA U2552 (ribose-2'-O)-methylase RlmE/FtsJ